MKKLISSMALAAFFAGTTVFAEPNYTTTTHATTGNDWTTTAAGWSSGAGAASGATYEALTSSGTTVVRTPVNSSSTFPGDQLTIDGNGDININNSSLTTPGGDTAILQLKGNISNAVYTFNSFGALPGLVLNGGLVNFGGGAGGPTTQTSTFAGSIGVNATSTFSNEVGFGGVVTSSSYVINALLSGNGTLNLEGIYNTPSASFSAPNFTVSNSSNTYTGSWNVIDSFLFGSAAGSLGTGNITLANHSVLETAYTLDDFGASLTLLGTGAKVDLNQNWTFNSMSFNGISLAPGTYNEAQLESALGMTSLNFTSDSTAFNTLSVIPEPSSSVLLLIGILGLGALFFRRRSHHALFGF